MKKVIGPFKLYEKKPNDITHGYLYECLFDTPLPKENKRMVRVFVPEDYFTNKNKRYGVCYMSDGQNLVDKYLSAYGEWDIDEHNFALMNEGYDGLIYVGIDCPKDSKARSAELTPSICDIKKSRLKGMQNYTQCGELYLDFIFDTLKPIIDENFKTKKDRKHTFFGGSSMGGLIAFFAAFYKSDMLSGVLSFIAFNMLTIPCFAAVATAKGELPKGKFASTLLFWVVTSYIFSTMIFLIGNYVWTLAIFIPLIVVAIVLLVLWHRKKSAEEAAAQ